MLDDKMEGALPSEPMENGVSHRLIHPAPAGAVPSEEKQIDSLERLIYDAENSHYDISIICGYRLIAEFLYKANYRRQIQAEWKFGYETGQGGYFCTNCKAGFVGENAEWIAKEHDYCPKCGAEMKGGAE
ncbi:MAG: hypothetical protein E7649_06185 [Ruminococcaceae bacterium]|nr:hypothetical protein [Oscillospiraceae bacterium]